METGPLLTTTLKSMKGSLSSQRFAQYFQPSLRTYATSTASTSARKLCGMQAAARQRHRSATCCTCNLSALQLRKADYTSTSPISTLLRREKSTSASPSESLGEATTTSTSSSSPDDRFTRAAEEELLQAPRNDSQGQPIGRVERRLSITFTCTVPSCGHRSSHEFSRQAYEKGIVLCQCPQCESRHLIADHLGWFNSDDLTQGGKYKTIEALLAAKGEEVGRAKVNPDGTLEVEKVEAE